MEPRWRCSCRCSGRCHSSPDPGCKGQSPSSRRGRRRRPRPTSARRYRRSRQASSRSRRCSSCCSSPRRRLGRRPRRRQARKRRHRWRSDSCLQIRAGAAAGFPAPGRALSPALGQPACSRRDGGSAASESAGDSRGSTASRGHSSRGHLGEDEVCRPPEDASRVALRGRRCSSPGPDGLVTLVLS